MLVVRNSLDISSSDCFHSATCMAKDQPVVLCVLSHFSVMSDSWARVWIVAHQPPLSMGFSRQEYWRGLLCPPPGDLPDQGIEPVFLCLLHWQAGSLPVVPLESPTLGCPYPGFLFSRIPSSFCIATGYPLLPANPSPLTPPTRKTWDSFIRILIPLCPFYCRFPLGLSHIKQTNKQTKKKTPKTQEIHCASLLPSSFESPPVSLCFCPRALKYLFLAFSPRAYVVISGKVSLLGAYSSVLEVECFYLCFSLVAPIASAFDAKLPAVLCHA